MKLSIVISCRNDPFGTIITVRSALEQFKTIEDQCEIIIVDNSEIEYKKQALEEFLYPFIKDGIVKLFWQDYQCLFSARDKGVENASGEYILIIDSHCLFYYNTLKEMLSFADSCDNLGILFGVVCYSKMHELDAYCDRSIERFLPIRICAYENIPKTFKIPLRSMPYMLKASLYKHMRGYWPLSKHRLVWGGGDFLISLKPLLLGYDNWILTDYGVVHLGPYPDKRHFVNSFFATASYNFPRFIGMLTAAYVIGGEKLLSVRTEQLSGRVGNKRLLSRMSNQAAQFGIEERRWLNSNSVVSYDEIVERFKDIQGNHLDVFHPCENLLPKGDSTDGDTYDPRFYSKKLIVKKISGQDNWKSRIQKQAGN